ncbi:MAG TPA: phytanoyl-CoA dioxygenase family protein [Solirubrobacteraceae bacterium]
MRRLWEVLGGNDLRWISGYASLKEARSPALWWHQDWWCWDHAVSGRRAAAQVALLCYLTDTEARNGALRLLPGSHLRSAPIHALLPEAHSDSAEGLESEHPAMSDLVGQRTVAVSAGDAVVMDYRLLHGAHANDSDARRDAVLLTFTPSWTELPADIRAHLIDHPAQPRADEHPTAPWQAMLLPQFRGERASLPLNRNAPARFDILTQRTSSTTP